MPGYAPGVGQRIRALRDALGWTQVEVAARLRMSPARISEWETGKALPRPRRLRALADLTAAPELWLHYLRDGGPRPLQFPAARPLRGPLRPLTREEALVGLSYLMERAAGERRVVTPEELIVWLGLLRIIMAGEELSSGRAARQLQS